MIPCSWKETFGVECMTCGAQRSAGLFFNGQLYDSFILFPALIPLAFTFIFATLHLYFKFKHGSKIIVYSFSISAFLIVTNFLYKIFMNSL